MTNLLLFAILLLGVASAQEVKEISPTLTLLDPTKIDPCFPKPTPKPPFLDWDGTYLSQEWWEYVKQTKIFKRSRSLKSRAVKRCTQPWSPSKDMRQYYWQISCPYQVFWLSKFRRTIPKSPSLTETCYVLFPCWEQVRIVNCTTTYCSIRCREQHPQIENSVCLENNLREYENVWVFCTHTHKNRRGKWIDVDCKKKPHWCIKKVTLNVPQSCECWSCWNMKVTMPDRKG
ncbi:uncharacterized protein LOC123556649 [Mercenaria mercenaria]|uniref:uncharacterized protein LOC123556649 n=1 Tax=Mercenaria mercenaria TaxID=6596 RepID=UPI00234F72D6|nr:uncharacterized protein LOC123556649 [Mercenaria mercenaria]